jgi:hypothetical protein
LYINSFYSVEKYFNYKMKIMCCWTYILYFYLFNHLSI